MRLMRNQRHAKTSGFSMIETLVAVVILSFGLLGVLSLQTAALKHTRDARLQAVAVGLGRELGEMMRSNAQLAAQAGNPYLGAFSGASLAPASSSGCLDSGQSCASPTDVAHAQMTDWLARVASALPGARVTVCADSSPYDSHGLPAWDCTAAPAAERDTTYIKIGWTREDGRGSIVTASQAAARPFVVFPVALHS
jgi:type IV pilus assembly protein PilV